MQRTILKKTKKDVLKGEIFLYKVKSKFIAKYTRGHLLGLSLGSE